MRRASPPPRRRVSGAAAAVRPSRRSSAATAAQPMQRLALAGHYGQSVDLDVCRGCDLVWFDGTETAQLSGPGAARADRPDGRGRDLPHELLRADTRCPRCAGALKTVHNQSRWGRSVAAAVPEARHGAYQSFAAVPRGEGAAQADVAGSIGPSCCATAAGSIASTAARAIGKDDERCP